MKLDTLNQLCCFKNIVVFCSEDPYYTNSSQLTQKSRKIWMDEKIYTIKSREGLQYVHRPLYACRRVKGLKS